MSSTASALAPDGLAAVPVDGAGDETSGAEAAGGWLLGARATKLDPYLRALRDAIDPDRIMNPGTL